MLTKPLFVYLTTIILIGTVIIFIPDKTMAVPPDVTLSFDESEVEIDVGTGESSIGTFNGRITSRNHAQPIEVNLAVEVGYGQTTIDPMSLILGVGINEETFQVTVRGDPFSSVGTHPIIVTGTAQNIPGGIIYDLESLEGIIKIKPYMIIRVNSTDHDITGKAGENVEISMTITNQGNYYEHYEVSLSDKNEPNVENWEVSTIMDMPLLAMPGQNHTIILKITIPNDVPDGKYEIIMSISGGVDSEGTAFEQGYSLYINVQSGGFSAYTWPWLVSAIIVVLLIIVVIWKRKYILSKFIGNR